MMRIEAGRNADEGNAGASTLLLLQAAAAEAQIGPFARRSLATPQAASSRYRDAARLVAARGAVAPLR